MGNPRFSVIVPAFNAEKHMRKGLGSIVSQEYKDYELIVVCDSCTDNTEAIAREYGARTDTVQFGYDGLTRDRGIEMATGDYVLFMDDDDWFLHEYVFSQLAESLNSNDVDMLAFGYIYKTKGYRSPKIQDELFTPRIAHVWSKCWRRDAIGSARFGGANFSSDTYFLRAMKQNVITYSILDMPMYYYNFRRPGSQTDLFCRGLLKQSPVAE